MLWGGASAPAGAKQCHAAPRNHGLVEGPSVTHVTGHPGTPVLPSVALQLLNPQFSCSFLLGSSPARPLAPAVPTKKGEHSTSQPLPTLQSMFLTQGVSAPLVAQMHLLAVTSIILACHIF